MKTVVPCTTFETPILLSNISNFFVREEQIGVNDYNRVWFFILHNKKIATYESIIPAYSSIVRIEPDYETYFQRSPLFKWPISIGPSNIPSFISSGVSQEGVGDCTRIADEEDY
jgi:hypothetical protein